MAFIPFPAGTILAFAGSVAPSGWLLCDGSAYSRDAYADAYAAIGVLYGAGNGSTTFNVPDMRGVFARGAGTNGTSNYGGVTGHTPAGGSLAAKGGQKTAKNGLTGSSGTTSANHSHGGTTGIEGGYSAAFGVAGVTGSSQNTQKFGSTGNCVVASADGFTHTHSFTSGNQSADHTHAITIGAGDTETVPASIALNYIIKI